MANLLQGPGATPASHAGALSWRPVPTSLLFDGVSHLADEGNPFVRGAFVLIVIALVVSAGAAASGFADFLAIDSTSRPGG